MGALCQELLIEDVGSGLLGRIRLCRGGPELARDLAFQAHFSHRLGHRVATGRFHFVVAFQAFRDLGTAVNQSDGSPRAPA